MILNTRPSRSTTRSLVVFMALAIVACTSPARAADALTSIDPRQIKIGGEIGRRIDVTVTNNLMVLDVDKDFLQPFRDRNRKGGYIGLGKLIDSLVRAAAYTKDEEVLARKKHVVAEAIKTQADDGYLGLFVPASRMWKLWDVHEMAYLVYGLTMDHRFFQEKPSLAAARKLADYIITQWSAHPDKIPGNSEITLHMAVTGLEPALLALYRQTDDKKYLDFCVKFRKVPEWDYPIVRGRWGQIGGHAYTYLCYCVAQLRLGRIEPDEKLLGKSRQVMDFLTRKDGLVITGTCGDHECWHDTQTGTVNLGETCTTAYLIRWLDELLRLEGDAAYGDLMERAIYNALFAAQSPDGRRIRYYSPFDGPRSYWKGDTYCCPCNYRRIITELPQMIYYRSPDGLLINLYTPSSARINLADGLSVDVRQQTDYPNTGRVLIEVTPSQSAKFKVQMRAPQWCREPKIAINGKAAGSAQGRLVTLDRQWQAGDRIELHMPMPWRLVRGRKAQAGRVAVMRGPVVFCLNRKRHKNLKNADLRLITIDSASIEGPVKNDTVHPNGMACKVRAWGPGTWYPFAKTNLQLTLTEFPDPGGEAAYFNVPNPNAQELTDDELIRLAAEKEGS